MGVSILMPVYNAAPFLAVCLTSILEQSLQDWELIAINDHSSDESKKILLEFAKNDPRIRVFDNPEKGIISALRLALSKSHYSLITRMDADDKMPTQKLRALRKRLLEMPEGSLSTGLVAYFSDGELQDGYRRYAKWLNETALSNTQYANIYRECVVPSPCWMMRKSDLISCGAFDTSRYPEDYDLVFRWYAQQIQIGVVPEVLHEWRDHANRSSRTRPEYAQAEYFKLKMPYFLQLDYATDRPLVLWGAGKKGKQLAKMLLEENIPFHWVCNTPRKWGLQVYGQLMESYEILSKLKSPKTIVAVSGPTDQVWIESYFQQIGQQAGLDYHFFV